jgi:hypothetical protein
MALAAGGAGERALVRVLGCSQDEPHASQARVSIVAGGAAASELRIGYQCGVGDPAPPVAVDAHWIVRAELHPAVQTDLSMLIAAGFSIAGRLVEEDVHLALRLRVDAE